MTRIRPFEPADVVALDLQANQQGVLGIFEPLTSLRYGYQLQSWGPAYTAEDGAGRVMACAGLAEVFADRQASAWALFGEGWWQALDRKAVIRALRAGLASAPYVRIEALARKAGRGDCRLLEALGMRRRVDLEQWGPHGETVVLFDRVKKGGG